MISINCYYWYRKKCPKHLVGSRTTHLPNKWVAYVCAEPCGTTSVPFSRIECDTLFYPPQYLLSAKFNKVPRDIVYI